MDLSWDRWNASTLLTYFVLLSCVVGKAALMAVNLSWDRWNASALLTSCPVPSSLDQGGAISSAASLGLSYCACSSAASLCNACLGQNSAGASGRRRSVLLLALAVGLALSFQYSLAPAIAGDGHGWWRVARNAPGGKHVYRGWTDGCARYLDQGAGVGRGEEGGEGGGDAAALAGPYGQCIGNAGVYRPTFFSFLFFLCASVATYLRPSLNREVWPAKVRGRGLLGERTQDGLRLTVSTLRLEVLSLSPPGAGLRLPVE